MSKIFRIAIPLIFLSATFMYGQRIDNTASFRNVTGDKYFRIHYDNDFYTGSDYYYTQGYQFELVQPFFRKNPLNRLLLQFKDSRKKYGVSFEHYGFTPTSIKSDKILYNDRPFAGVIMLKSFKISVDSVHRQRLTSQVSAGMIGPAAFAGKMQATIHRWSGDAEPHGWQYQIRNDVIVNYELNHEKEIFNVPNIVSLNTTANLRIGTLSDKAQAGFTLTLGRFDSPFRASEKSHSKNFQLYIFSQPMVGVVAYDATMQGGIFNRTSPYTIKANEINRFTFQYNYGLVANIWKVHVEYDRTFITREFKAGRTHGWGGVKIGYAF